MKKRKQIIIFAVLLFLIALIGIVFYAQSSNLELPIKKIIEKFSVDKRETKNNFDDNVNGFDEKTTGSGFSVGDSSERKLTSPKTNCLLRQISYSIGELEKEETCNIFQGDVCADKTITCSIVIKNLDDVGGTFKLNFLFFEKDKNVDDSFEIKTEEISVNKKSSGMLTTSANVQNPEIADKEIICFYKTLEVPKKEVC